MLWGAVKPPEVRQLESGEVGSGPGVSRQAGRDQAKPQAVGLQLRSPGYLLYLFQATEGWS